MELSPPPSDDVKGALFRWGEYPKVVLVKDGWPSHLPGEVLHTGQMVVCYALPFLYERDSLLPQLVVDDFRRMHHGRVALEFMIRRGDAFPRADVVGRRVSTGQRADLFLKQLDLAAPLEAYVYSHLDALLPLARLDMVVQVDDAIPDWSALTDDEAVPSLLRQAVPCYRINRRSLDCLPEWVAGVLS
jgi:hypothetical protein